MSKTNVHVKACIAALVTAVGSSCARSSLVPIPTPDVPQRKDSTPPSVPEIPRALLSEPLTPYSFRQTVVTAEVSPFPFQTGQALRRDSVTVAGTFVLETKQRGVGLLVSMRADSVQPTDPLHVDSLGGDATFLAGAPDTTATCRRPVIASPSLLLRVLAQRRLSSSGTEADTIRLPIQLCLGFVALPGQLVLVQSAPAIESKRRIAQGRFLGNLTADSTRALPLFVHAAIEGTYRVAGKEEWLLADSTAVTFEVVLRSQNARMSQAIRQTILLFAARVR